MDFKDFYSLATREGASRGIRMIAGLESKRRERDFREFTALSQERDKQTEMTKSTITSLINSYNTAKSAAMRENIRQSMKSFVSAVNPYLRPAIEPYIKNSPISEQAEKERAFLEHFPEPPSPNAYGTINGKPIGGGVPSSEAATMENPMAYAERHFRFEDWKRKKAIVLGGQDPGKPADFLKLPTGGAVIRKESGQLIPYTEEELGFKEAAEKFDIPIGKLYANGGYVASDEFKIIEGGSQVTYKSQTNIIDDTQPRRLEVVSRTAVPGAELTYPSGYTKFLTAFHGKDEKDAFANLIRNEIEAASDLPKEQQAAALQETSLKINSTFGGIQANIVKREKIPKKFLGLISYGETEEFVILTTKGNPTALGLDAKGNPVVNYVDDNGIVRDMLGRFIASTPQEAATLIAQGASEGKTVGAIEGTKEPKQSSEERSKKMQEAAHKLTATQTTKAQRIAKIIKEKRADDKELLKTLSFLPGFLIDELIKKPADEIIRMLKDNSLEEIRKELAND